MYFKPPTPSDNPANPFYHPMNAKFVHTEEVEQVDETVKIMFKGFGKEVTDFQQKLKKFGQAADYITMMQNFKKHSNVGDGLYFTDTNKGLGFEIHSVRDRMMGDKIRKLGDSQDLGGGKTVTLIAIKEDVQLDEGSEIEFKFSNPMKAGAFMRRIMRDKLASEVDRYGGDRSPEEIVQVIMHPNDYERNDIERLAKQYKGQLRETNFRFPQPGEDYGELGMSINDPDSFSGSGPSRAELKKRSAEVDRKFASVMRKHKRTKVGEVLDLLDKDGGTKLYKDSDIKQISKYLTKFKDNVRKVAHEMLIIVMQGDDYLAKKRIPVREDVQLDENVQNQVKRMDRRAKQRLAKQLNDLDLSGYGDYEARIDNVHKFKSSDLKMAMQMLKMNEEEQMNEEKKFKARIAFMGEPKDNARDMRAAGRMKMYDTATERNVPSKRKSTVFDITFKSERQFNQFMGAYDVEFLDRLDESRDDFDYLDVQAAMQDAKLEAPKVVKTRQGYQVMVFSRKLRKHIPQGPPHRSKSAAEKDAKMFEDVQLDEATPGDTRVVTKGDQNQYERISRALTAAKKAGKIAGYEGTVFNRSKGEVTLIFDTKAHKPASERRKVAKMIKDFGLEFNHSVEEGFASDAQRRAAFASGYKAKGKKKNEEEEIKEGLRQAMSAPRETPAQKRKRQEKDNFDLYKKRQKRISALRGDKSSRKLTPKQQRDYLRRVNLDQIRAMEEVEVNEEKGTYSSMNRRGIDKPLLAYIAALDDELKKMGMKYSDKKVDPVIVMKAYNANKSPKEAAKMFKK
jgi:hypothetical protein